LTLKATLISLAIGQQLRKRWRQLAKNHPKDKDGHGRELGSALALPAIFLKSSGISC
jgi:hypothetical protein